jgi:sigma-B regulation protein RsbU (phosphoserine phosphatase)
MDYVVSERLEFLYNTMFIMIAITVLFAVLYILILNKTMVSPIKRMASAAKEYINTKTDTGTESSSISALKVKTGDELEQLCVSLKTMEQDINAHIENLRTVTAEKERIGAELDVAKHIQASMLPCIFPAFPERKEIDIYATMEPAKEVGGDFYDFFMVDDTHLAIVMADVSGKGVPAALFMVIGKTLIKDHTTPGRDLGKVFTEVNQLLCESNSEDLFITAFEGVLDLVTGEFVYVNAGHEMPFICKVGANFEPQRIRAGFVLAGMEGMKYRAGSMMLEPGDKIF